MTKRKDLSFEELEKVSGGFSTIDCTIEDQFTIEISYEDINNHINEEALFVFGGSAKHGWCLARLKGAYEASNGCQTLKMIKLDIIDGRGFNTPNGEHETSYTTHLHIFIRG